MPRDLKYSRPWLYAKQEAAIFCAERYGVIEATTKAGKTVGCIAWLTEQAILGKPRQNFWWIAPVYSQSKIAFRRLKGALPPELVQLGKPFYDANESELTITLGGRVLWFKTAEKPDSLYGEDVYAAVIDEATRCREEAWHAIRSTLTATQGPIRIIGNVKGRKNWAYQLARKAESGEPGMHYAKLTAPDAVEAGILAAEEIDDAKRQLPEAVFRELYMAEPSDDQGNPFGLDAIRQCINGRSDLAPAVWGWDLAKSTDWTVGIALDVNGHVCRICRWQAPWETTFRDIIDATGEGPALVDSTGVGDPILERLQLAVPGVFVGLKFSSASKQQLMEGLAVAIQQRQIHFPPGVLVNELEAFEFEYSRTGVKYTAPEGMHDDCVCALALAVQQWRRREVFRFYDPSDREETAQDREEALAAQTAMAAQDVLDAIRTEGVFWPRDHA